MATLNQSGDEVHARIVYYGTALSGKTTNLTEVIDTVPGTKVGKISSTKSRSDRTVSFQFTPKSHPDVAGFPLRITIATIQGEVSNPATSKLILGGVDAIVFVADSTREKNQENIDCLRSLEENLNDLGLSLDRIPWVIQYNKRDQTSALPVEEMDTQLNVIHVPAFEACARSGMGVAETFEGIVKLLHETLTARLSGGDIAEVHPGALAGDGESFESAVDSVFQEVDGDRPGAQTGAGAGETGMFQSEGEGPIDSEVGRTLSLEEAEAASDLARGDDSDEFITDPMGSRSDAEKEKEKQAEQARKEAETTQRKEEETARREAEAARKEAEAEARRKAKEEEQMRKAAEAEAKRKAKEAEKIRKAAEAEAARRAKEEEKLRKAAEAEAARQAKEAEKLRKAAEAEAARQAKEEERLRAEAQAEAARRAKEEEKLRKEAAQKELERVHAAEQARRDADMREAALAIEALGKAEAATKSDPSVDVKVPVVITRSQIRKSVPLRLILEVTVVDD